jgi:hypothetical protein
MFVEVRGVYASEVLERVGGMDRLALDRRALAVRASAAIWYSISTEARISRSILSYPPQLAKSQMRRDVS